MAQHHMSKEPGTSTVSWALLGTAVSVGTNDRGRCRSGWCDYLATLASFDLKGPPALWRIGPLSLSWYLTTIMRGTPHLWYPELRTLIFLEIGSSQLGCCSYPCRPSSFFESHSFLSMTRLHWSLSYLVYQIPGTSLPIAVSDICSSANWTEETVF